MINSHLYLCTGVLNSEEFVTCVLVAPDHFMATKKFPELFPDMKRALNVVYAAGFDTSHLTYEQQQQYKKNGAVVPAYYQPCVSQLAGFTKLGDLLKEHKKG